MSRPIPVPSRHPTGLGWEQIFFHGMGWDQISVGWELPVPRQARTRTGMGQDLGGMGAPIPVPRSAYVTSQKIKTTFNMFKKQFRKICSSCIISDQYEQDIFSHSAYN